MWFKNTPPPSVYVALSSLCRSFLEALGDATEQTLEQRWLDSQERTVSARGMSRVSTGVCVSA